MKIDLPCRAVCTDKYETILTIWAILFNGLLRTIWAILGIFCGPGAFSGYYAVQMICAGIVYGISTLLPHMLGAMNKDR